MYYHIMIGYDIKHFTPLDNMMRKSINKNLYPQISLEIAKININHDLQKSHLNWIDLHTLQTNTDHIVYGIDYKLLPSIQIK